MSVKPLEDEGPLRDRLPLSVFRLLPTCGTNARIAYFVPRRWPAAPPRLRSPERYGGHVAIVGKPPGHARFRLKGECYA
jgi:hypothetical protein